MLKRLKRWLSDEHPEQVLIDMRPERPRHWHNPADPIQAGRIEAAREKRAMRAERVERLAARGYCVNRAHAAEVPTLDPSHVVRS